LLTTIQNIKNVESNLWYMDTSYISHTIGNKYFLLLPHEDA